MRISAAGRISSVSSRSASATPRVSKMSGSAPKGKSPSGTSIRSSVNPREETSMASTGVMQTWDEWLAVAPPYPQGNFSTRDVAVRYRRNGYDWDIHGTLYTPKKETNDKTAFGL